MEAVQRTQFYVPNSETGWIFANHDLIENQIADIGDSIKGVATVFDLSGLCSHSNMNANMKELLSKLGIFNETTEDLIDAVRNYCGIIQRSSSIEISRHDSILTELNISSEISAKIIYEVYYLKKNKDMVSRKYNVDVWKISKLVKRFKRNSKLIKLENQSFMNKRRKCNQIILEEIREYCIAKRYSNFTLNDLRMHLKNIQGDGWDASKSTLARVLKKNIGMSYKKVNKIHPNVLTEENKRKMIEALGVQIKLENLGFTVVYIDEFKFSCHRSGVYGWAFKGRTGYKKLLPCKFQATFIVAVSTKKVHGVLATTHTINSKVFKYFLCKFVTSMNESYAIICDNSKVHVSKLIQEFLNKEGLCIITIPAYSPTVNACEKLILNIKSRVRKIEGEGLEITLMTFKRCFDSIGLIELQRCVTESFLDTLNILK